MLPDLTSLRLLADVDRLGGIGAAGRAAGISQQSASERLRQMEALTGLALVQRAHRGSRLTTAGRLLVEWSADLLTKAETVETALATLRGERSQMVRVHASMTTAEHLLPRWLVRLREQRPVAVSLRAANSHDVVEAVRSGEADLGFVEGPVDVDGLATAVVGSDDLALVAVPGDPWARRRGPVSPEVVAARSLTWREPGSGTRGVVTVALDELGLTIAEPEAELTTNAAVLAAVRAGGAPAFVSARAAAADLDAGAVVAVTVGGLSLSRSFRAVWVGGPTPPAGPVRDLLAIAQRG